MGNYEPVIGIEVHVELNTKTKMFCRCSADYFGKEPNTHVCPVCLGLPGALPYINEEAIKKCLQIGLALNCKVNPRSYFERKNYFYPDLPKGYQISQLVFPLNVAGFLEVEGLGGSRRIRINRAHQEEDTGKLTHVGNETMIDFNRSGVPLVEIVTEPDFHTSAEVKDYAKKLQRIFRYLGVSNADMERGDMRLEANVSVRKLASHLSSGNTELPNYRVELKNINSFRFMTAAIEFEIKRQIEALEKGEKLTQETRGWNEAKKETYLQRSKEEAHDYRYFPEPDIPPITTSRGKVDELEKSLPELPGEKTKRFQKDYGLSNAQASVLTEYRNSAEFYEEAVKHGKALDVDPVQIANHIINRKVNIQETLPARVVEEILGKKAGVIGDAEKLEKLSKEAIEENPTAVGDYGKGKENALQVLIGAVMRKSAGKADAGKVRELLKKLLV
ncbi:MAG: aspartyl-tRNA(Asn)/glutamyl-tRNA (Gln) amidotransferase subunit B [Microgenomates group bacterium Gr01-1014_80]|nr:MAG: aspartyl-tRNA(Asn)/glutamyl-tRNA (Gln) amidotransferase subunit B [Microgenomates group bacterium Gr01-1014_80]